MRRTVAVVVLLLAVAGARPAVAHSNLIASSPSPGATVGGRLERIQLEFDRGVIEVLEVTLEDLDGRLFAGRAEQLAPTFIEFELDESPSQPGDYIVRYSVLSDDGDLSPFGYVFTYDPDAAEAAPLAFEGAEPGEDGGTSTIIVALLVAGLIVGLVMAGAGWFLLRRGSKRDVAAQSS